MTQSPPSLIHPLSSSPGLGFVALSCVGHTDLLQLVVRYAVVLLPFAHLVFLCLESPHLDFPSYLSNSYSSFKLQHRHFSWKAIQVSRYMKVEHSYETYEAKMT